MNTATFAWRGLDDPHRFDMVRADFDGDTCTAGGASVTLDYELTWHLDVGDGWRTRSLRVERRSRSGARTRLELERSPDGTWSGGHTEMDTHHRSPLPAETLRLLGGSLDCDLGKCPFTNFMPIRRIVRDGPTGVWVSHTMAWVKVPSLEVVPIAQQYMVTKVGREGATALYRGATNKVHELTTDADHVVLDYPFLAERVLPIRAASAKS
jgi:hypothetical protein